MDAKPENRKTFQKIIYGLLILIGAILLILNGYFIPVLLGLLSLNLVVLIHESGHYIVARKTGVEVLTFSIGMGPRLFGIKYKGIDYRVSLLPIGGYVRMKGESLFDEALKNNDRSILEEEGSLFSISPFKRILVAIAGISFNLISAVIFFFITALIGFSTPTDLRVAPINYYYPKSASPAAEGGLVAGDQIVRINNKKIINWKELTTAIKKSDEIIEITVLREKQEIELKIKTQNENGKKIIGIVPIQKTIISSIQKKSPAWNNGIQKGDQIIEINKKPIEHFSIYFLHNEIQNNKDRTLTLTLKRNEKVIEKVLNLKDPNNSKQYIGTGFMLKPYRIKEGNKNLKAAIFDGFTLPSKWIWENFSGMAKIAKDPEEKFSNNIAGPIMITTGIGEMVKDGFGEGFTDGLGIFLKLTAIISSIIAIMNLLPLPALDGGMVILSLIEWIRKKPFSPKAFFRYQLIGFTIIMGLGILIIMTDISHFF